MEFGGWDGAAEEAEGVRGQERAQGKECGVRGQRRGPGHQTIVLRVEESSERTGSTGALLRGRRVSSRFCHT